MTIHEKKQQLLADIKSLDKHPLNSSKVQALLNEAIVLWNSAGYDGTMLGNIHTRWFGEFMDEFQKFPQMMR